MDKALNPTVTAIFRAHPTKARKRSVNWEESYSTLSEEHLESGATFCWIRLPRGHGIVVRYIPWSDADIL